MGHANRHAGRPSTKGLMIRCYHCNQEFDKNGFTEHSNNPCPGWKRAQEENLEKFDLDSVQS